MAERVWMAATRRSDDDLSMICKDCTKAEKKNAFTSGFKNFQRSALVT